MPSGVLLIAGFVYKVGSMEWKKLLLRAVIGKTYEQTNNLCANSFACSTMVTTNATASTHCVPHHIHMCDLCAQ